MAEQMYSAEEAARILGLQVRTVRGYIREGRLPGRRIGKQYRIARVDLEAFTAGFGGSAGTVAAAAAGHGGPEQAPHAVAEVSSVVQIDAIDLPAWERLERTLTAVAAGSGGGGGSGAGDMRLEPLYDEQRRRLRLIIVASVPVTAELLRVIEALTRDGG